MAKNTYIVFSSDNGYHLGQHQLSRGKQTAFDTDIRVPLIIAGPGVPRGRVVSRVAQNTDLYPTFVRLAGGTPSRTVDGQSLLPLLHPPRKRPPWRTVALIEHRHVNKQSPNDPDTEDGAKGGNPTSYEAVRISTPRLPGFKGAVEGVYVQYQDSQHEIEYYNIARDPFERDNIARSLTRTQKAELRKVVARLASCHGSSACWRAGLPR
jgi:N-acetylglucosamine-6-sulfatase